MTQPTLTVELGYLSGWTLGTSLLGTSTYLAEVTYSQDISADVRSVSIRRGRQHELNRIEAGTASVQVLNQDGAMTRIPPMTNIRIRAEIDTNPFPSSIAGLVGRYDFSDISTLFTDTAMTTPVSSDGQTIAAIQDKSGLGRHLTNVTVGERPTYKTAILNGLSLGRFDGGDALESAAVFGGITTGTIFAVMKRTGAGAVQVATDSFQFAWISPNIRLYDGVGVSGSDWGTADYNIGSGLVSGASSRLYKNGVSDAGPGNAGVNAMTIFTIGSSTGTGANFWTGDIAEVIVYSSVFAAADHNLVGNYLATKYGLTWTTV